MENCIKEQQSDPIVGRTSSSRVAANQLRVFRERALLRRVYL